MSIAVPINPFATLTAQSTLASLPDPGANWGRERYLNHSAGQLTTQREMIQLGGRAPAGAAVGAATSRTPSMEGAPERGQFYDGRSRCSARCVGPRLGCGPSKSAPSRPEMAAPGDRQRRPCHSALRTCDAPRLRQVAAQIRCWTTAKPAVGPGCSISPASLPTRSVAARQRLDRGVRLGQSVGRPNG